MFNLIDLNECSRDDYYCHQAASCTNYRGSFKCTCDKGYFGDGFDCASIVTGLYLNFLRSYNFRREKLKQLKLIYGRYQPHNQYILVHIANAPSLGQVKCCCCCCCRRFLIELKRRLVLLLYESHLYLVLETRSEERTMGFLTKLIRKVRWFTRLGSFCKHFFCRRINLRAVPKYLWSI